VSEGEKKGKDEGGRIAWINRDEGETGERNLTRTEGGNLREG